MTSKYMNKNGERKLLATVAVFAMVLAMVGAFIFIDSDVNAASTESSIPTGTMNKLAGGETISSAGVYYADADVTVTSTSANIDVYLVGTGKLTVTTITSGTVSVYLVTSVDSTTGEPTKCVDGLKVNAAAGEKISADSANKTLVEVGSTVSNGTYSMAIVDSSESTTTYYSVGNERSTDLTLDTSDSVTITNGSVTVVVGTDKIAFSAVVGTVMVSESSGMNVGGSFSKGSITMVSGKATISGSLSFSGTAKLNAFASAAVDTSSTIISSDYAGTGSVASPYVYGNAASKTTISKSGSDVTVNFVNASSNSVTIMDGSASTSVIVNVSGNAIIKGSGAISDLDVDKEAFVTLVNGKFTMANGENVTKDVTLTVSAGVDLKLEHDAASTLKLAGKMNVYGNLVSTNAITLGVQKDNATPGEFRSYDGSSISNKIKIAEDGTGNLSAIIIIATEDKIVSGSAMGDETYYQSQNVIVNGSYDVKNGSVVTIYGGLEIPEGAIVTINAGSTISVEGSASVVKIAGKLILEGDAKFVVKSGAKSVSISGQVETDNTSTLDISAASAVIENGGYVTSLGILKGSDMTVGTGSDLVINGDMAITSIKNNGTVVLEGAVLTAAVSISNVAAGAEVNIISFTVVTANTDKLTVNDKKLPDPTGADVPGDNSIVFKANSDGTGYAGIVITTGVTTVSGTPVTYTKEMYIEGEIVFEKVASFSYVSGDIAIDGTGIVIDSKLTLGENVQVTIGTTATKFIINGEFDAFKGTFVAGGSEDIVVNGKMIYDTSINTGVNISAAEYVTKVSAVPYYNYTTFDQAIDSGSKSILLLGTVAVIEDDEVPADVTIDVGKSKLSVGTATVDDVVLTVADGALFKMTGAGSVTVYGTLEFVNKANNKIIGIISDVEAIGEVSSMYTNVYKAMSGEAVEVTITGDVILTKDLTIGEGSKLTIPLGKDIKINNNVTLTIEGNLVAKGTISAQTVFASKASTTSSAVIVSGVIESSAGMSYDDYAIAGAYYDDGVIYTITTIENAVLSEDDITVYGKVTENVSVTLVDDVTLTIDSTAVAVFDGIEIQDEAAIVTLTGGSISTTITSSTAVVKIDGEISIANVPAAGTVAEYTKVTNVKGTMVVLDGTLEVDNTVVANGSSIAVDSDAVLDVPKTKTLAINGDKINMTIEGILSVNGTLTIINTEKVPVIYGTLDINDNGSSAYALQIIGVLDVASTKSFTVVDLTVGSLDNLGANGVVIGKVNTTNVKAYSGADISEMDKAGLVYTDFYVNDVLFATVVTTSSAAPLINRAISDDEIAAIPGIVASTPTWYKENGLKVGATDKVGDYESVYATIATANVDIIVSVEPGIQLELDYRFYTATDKVSLSAGTYKVAAKDLNGQKDVKIIIIVDGVETVVADGQITIDSKMIGKKVIVQASYGSAPGPTPAPVDPSEDFIVSTSVVDDKKVIVSVISLDGGYLVAGTEVEVTFTTLVETVAFGQTVYKPTPVTETITIGDDKPTLENSTYELADILGDKYAVINVISKIGTAGFGNTSLNYKG